MKEYIISTCSTADLKKEFFVDNGVPFLKFKYYLDEKEYKDDLWESLSVEEFYRIMSEGANSKTSQVSPYEYLEHFKDIIESGKDVIHVCLSSGISGSYNSACIARSQVLDEYPDAKVYIIDSLCASSGLGLLVSEMVDQKKNGMNIEELYKWAEEYKFNINHWFTSTDLTYFVRGGRVSKVSGFIGSMLNVCPILNVDSKGTLKPRLKAIGKRRALDGLINKMIENADNGQDYDGKCFISHSNFYEEAENLKKLIEKKFAKLEGKIIINDIGSTIGAHTGPGTVALFFVGKKRED